MELVDENLVIDLIENQKLSNEPARNVLKERFPGVRSLSSWCVRKFCSMEDGDGSFQQGNICILIMMYMKKFVQIFLRLF